MGGEDLAFAIPSCATATTTSILVYDNQKATGTYESPHLQDALPQASLTGVWMNYIMSGLLC